MRAARILVLPGMGDIHWVALKLRAFCEAKGIDTPELWIWDFDGRKRSLGFVERLPMATAGGYWEHPIDPQLRGPFRASYMWSGHDAVPDFQGFDWFLCFNGSLRVGLNLERDILPGLATDWGYELRQTLAEVKAGRQWREQGPYVLLYFSGHGMFSHWLRRWPVVVIRDFILELARLLPEHRLLLTGASWDQGPIEQSMAGVDSPRIVDLTGRTSFDELMGLIRNADGFAGWCGGNTIISTHIGTPTYVLWSSYFRPEFYTNWVDPQKLGSVYRFDTVETTSPADAAETFAAFVQERRGA